MALVSSWELISAVPVEGGVEVTALVEHCDGSTRLTTAVVAIDPERLDEWVEAVRGKRIEPPTS